MKLLILELNEINLEAIRSYTRSGSLPVFAQLLTKHGLIETTSEQKYEELEPWIQWVTAHTGQSLAEHGVFRLGDIVDRDIPQIWEVLEAQGFSVGAISPMNAKNRCRDAAFFVPDPWTATTVTGPALLKRLSAAIAEAVNENASARLKISSMAWLGIGLITYALPRSYFQYLRLLAGAARGKPWAKALILDRLLADIFIRQLRTHNPDFASIFLNAGAHIQHHYMFNSKVYAGSHSNPDWYLAPDSDPVLDVYSLYDRILGELQNAFPGVRLMIATGLHQDPYPEVAVYWRLKDHEAFLRRGRVPFQRVEPRMSRDFIIYCSDEAEAAQAAERLRSFRTFDGTPLFDVDNRGASLFVMLIWAHEIESSFEYRIDNEPIRGFRDDVAFVAIKNGEHNSIGYLIDTAEAPGNKGPLPLRDLPDRMAAACGGHWLSPQPAETSEFADH